MKITFNPIKLRQQVRYYATLCSKQCLALINANDHIAELIAENQQQQKQIRFLQSELKIAQDKAQICELSLDLMQQKKGK